MKEKASDLTKALCLRSFLTAYALCTAFHAPLAPGQYETFIDYAIASIYEILGEYDLRFFLLLLLAVVFYRFAHRRLEGTEQDGRSWRAFSPSASCSGRVIIWQPTAPTSWAAR